MGYSYLILLQLSSHILSFFVFLAWQNTDNSLIIKFNRWGIKIYGARTYQNSLNGDGTYEQRQEKTNEESKKEMEKMLQESIEYTEELGSIIWNLPEKVEDALIS